MTTAKPKTGAKTSDVDLTTVVAVLLIDAWHNAAQFRVTTWLDGSDGFEFTEAGVVTASGVITGPLSSIQAVRVMTP